MNAQIAVPERMANNPRDERGYTIPWNVMIDANGKPLFTANNSGKHMHALLNNWCPLCGMPNDEVKWFVGGPLSAFHPNGWYFDLPGHEECITYALQVCPYLAAKNYLHRIDLPKSAKLPETMVFVDNTQIKERPVLFVAVGCTEIEIKSSGTPMKLPYVRPQKESITGVQFWRHGKQLSEEELKTIPDIFTNET